MRTATKGAAAAAFWLLLAGIFAWALAVMVATYRGRLLQRWKQMLFRMALQDLPTERELEAEGKPTLGGVWLGILMLAAGRWLGWA